MLGERVRHHPRRASSSQHRASPLLPSPLLRLRRVGYALASPKKETAWLRAYAGPLVLALVTMRMPGTLRSASIQELFS